MKMLSWIPGRQANTTYHKWCFLYVKIGRWGFDGYILRYAPRTILHPHTDIVDGKMWRMNIKLIGGALFNIERTILSIGEFIHIFRPDLYVHSLITWSKTYKLSLGVAKFNKI